MEKLKKKSKVGIFFYSWQCESVTLMGGKEPIQSHLSWNVGPLHIFFTSYKYPLFRWLMSYEVMKFQLCILKTLRMHVEFMFNDLLTVNPLFLTPLGIG